jgi:hypothetical protein
VKLEPCICNNTAPHVDRDAVTKGAWIECLSCHRVVADNQRHDAELMWNAALRALRARQSAGDR